VSKLSRRSLLFGGLLKNAKPTRDAEAAASQVTDILSRSRNRAPWETARPALEPGAQVARVLTFDCLITMGASCTSCVERCPEPGAIIATATHAPRIDPNVCTGCGDCVLACPAPKPAIAIAECK
jgi:Na+-translocating ferredoxin:NAD+ oxidoreductase RNF subunit RnfB